MFIGGFQKFSLIDYPQKIAAIVFTNGCNFRCPYCHNPELVTSFRPNKEIGEISSQQILGFLKTRQGKLDGIVITGGEPALHNDLAEFCAEVKELGYLIKLDTNGTNPDMLATLISHNLIDYIAMDIKGPVDKYHHIVRTDIDINNIKKSIELLQTSGIDHEFRTTVVRELLKIDDFKEIAKLVKNSKYYLQKFEDSKILDNSNQMTTYSDEEFDEILDILNKEKIMCEIR